jgi:hypothetical protein
VVVAAVQQNALGGDEPGCAEPPQPCNQDPTQPICARAAQIRLFKVNALDATGPVFARHVGDRMYGVQHMYWGGRVWTFFFA